MRFLQQTNIDGGVYLLPAVQVSITEQEINWLLEGLDGLILPDRSKRVKRALKRALNEIEERQGVDA
jgi:hypothetical protein|tara:strand:- start:247 stop:447 length:201 start_codon:yes stop_codon:yes gene_type:complete